MKTIKSIFVLSLFAIISLGTYAQNISKGSIEFTLELDEDNPAAAMMGDSKLEIFFTETQYRTNINMMMGLMQIQSITNTKDPSKNKLYMNMMGKKYELTDIAAEQQAEMNQFFDLANIGKIVYDKKDTKTILGYACYKATITKKDNTTVVYYITDKIQINALMNQVKGTTLVGFPLLLITETDGMQFKFKAKKINKELSANAFELPTGYEKISYDDFKKMSGE